MKKNQTAIDDMENEFNNAVTKLFHLYLSYETGIKMEDLKIWKMRTSMLVARELQSQSRMYTERKAQLEVRTEKVDLATLAFRFRQFYFIVLSIFQSLRMKSLRQRS